LLTTLFISIPAADSSAQTCTDRDCVYFTQTDSVSAALVQAINAETVRIDMSAWYLDDAGVYTALLNRFRAGVPVRLIGDRDSIFEIDQHTRDTFEYLASQGVPIRLRYNPTWYPEIDHWKATMFVGQGLVEFGSPNYTFFELAPYSSTNYNDENALFTSDPALFTAMESKFDVYWNDTQSEPESIAGGAPYFKNWNDACALESACSDYYSTYPNPAPMVIETRRLFGDVAPPPDLIFGQGPDFNNRITSEINNEGTSIDMIVYRLTVPDITQALLSRFQAGVRTRLIIEPNEYLNRKWPEFWITHANVDSLWAAGVPILQRAHEGNTHAKTLITSSYATIASSNFAAAWQRDHNYFVSATGKGSIYAAIEQNFQWMWTNSSGFTTFVPQAADTPTLAAPAAGAASVSTTTSLTWDIATFATNYDVYLGTSASSLARVGNVQAQLVNNPPSSYSWTPGAALACSTTYYWQVVSRTNATPKNPSLVSPSPVWSFTTGAANCGSGNGGGGGTGGGPLPSPWSSQDIGATGQSGSASYSSGTFTISGAGSDIWGSADSFQLVSQATGGDTTIIARVVSEQNTSTYAKAGVMIRQALTATSPHVILDVRPDGSVEFMTRPSDAGPTTFVGGGSQSFPAWLKLVRSGSTISAYTSPDGSTWTTVGSTSTSMSASASTGLVVTSHNTGALNTSTFDNVGVAAGGGGGGGGGGSGLPSPWVNQDVGSTGAPGTTSYANGAFTVSGAGADIWGSSDAFQFAYQPLSGDGTIVARVSAEQNTSTFAKAGIMIRQSLTSTSPHVILDVRPDGTIEFMTRSSDGATTTYIGGGAQPFPSWLKLVRSGSSISAYTSADGSSWTIIGTTTTAMPASTDAGLIVTSHATGVINTSTFDNVAVTAGGTPSPPPPSPAASNVVVDAANVPSANLHGEWSVVADLTAAGGMKLSTPDGGVKNTSSALAAPVHYVDVPLTANAGTEYTLWLRVQALNNSKLSDSLYVQFSDAQVSGTGAYPIGTTSALVVNLATDGSGSSLSGWGWVNGAYWLGQAATFTFPTSGPHTLRMQVREDGVQVDQIVLSPSTFFNAGASCPNTCGGAPGPVSNDQTIVPEQ
jgi:phosphatidylserine/phosphatidylglycerophosphate/cardiolipin synthase-like enzyme